MTRILTLDLATVSGWATWAPGCEVEYGTWRLPLGIHGARWGRFQEWLTTKLSFYGVERAFAEERVYYPEKQSFASVGIAGGLSAIAHLTCFRAGVPLDDVNNAKFRKHFIGVGRGPREKLKHLTMLACRARDWEPQDDNAADALALLDYESCQLNLPWPHSFGRLSEQGAA